jgi:hypothetical protein
MKRQKLSVGLTAAAFALTVGSAWAQDRGRPQGEQQSSRPSNGDTVGSAVPRGGGGDSGSSAGSSAGSTSSGSSGSSSAGSNSAGSGSADSPTPWASAPVRERAPMRPERMDRDRTAAAEQRRGGGSSSGTVGRAVPRGESGGRTGGGSTSATSGSDNQSAPERRAVPTYSRPRDGRTPLGTAVERSTALPGRTSRGGYYYDPYYSFYYDPYYTGRYSYWSPFGYGYGLGYFSYDPFLFSGYGYPGAYGYDPYGYGYGGGGAGYSSGYSTQYRGSGSIRLKVKPANAQVYVDGFYVGVIDSFDGVFQKLSVDAGPHRIELKADGFEPVEFEVVVTPGDTVTYKGDMKAR